MSISSMVKCHLVSKPEGSSGFLSRQTLILFSGQSRATKNSRATHISMKESISMSELTYS